MKKTQKMGPNIKNLFIRFVSREAIPDGGGIGDGIKMFTDVDHRHKVMDRALENMNVAIEAVRLAPDNPYGDDQEVIAGVILEELVKKENSK